MTVAIRTEDPARHLVANGTQRGATQTAPKPNVQASSQTRRMSSLVASGFNSVWSISLVNSARVIVRVPMNVWSGLVYPPATLRYAPASAVTVSARDWKSTACSMRCGQRRGRVFVAASCWNVEPHGLSVSSRWSYADYNVLRMLSYPFLSSSSTRLSPVETDSVVWVAS